MLLLLLLAATQPRVAVFTGRDAVTLLRQCSRAAPAPLGLWRPSAAEIAAAETAAAAAVVERTRRPGGFLTGVADLRRRWRTEATGVTADGRRLVYLNFVPRSGGDAARGPTVVCDGGARFFGASVDLARRRVAVDFNGPF